MFPIQDQISVATKANLEANFALYSALTNKTLESIEKLVNLNLAAVKASMEESSAAARQLLSAKDANEFFTLVNAQAKPNLEKAIAYSSHLANIATTAQAEYTKAAEQQIAEAARKVNELVEDATAKAPAGYENVTALIKATLGNANNGYEQLTKTTKQAIEAFETNVNAAVSQMAQAAGQKAPAKA